MITVLRLGHRLKRDERLSTHVGLAARALGASGIVYSGDEDAGLLDSVRSVTTRWGGRFSVGYETNWKKTVSAYKKKKFCICHLTMYGLPLQKKIRTLRKKRKVLVIIGSEKVPHELYDSADFNISVTSQPHSEVAALSVFLHEYHKGKELERKFPKAHIRIVPQERGKNVVEGRK